MSTLTCHLCGLELCSEGDGYIPLIGENEQQKTARWLESTLAHMAARHPHVVQQINKTSAAIGYLVLIENIRTDEQVIAARTQAMLDHTIATVERLEAELTRDPERILKAFN